MQLCRAFLRTIENVLNIKRWQAARKASAHQAGSPLPHLHALLICKHLYPHSHRHTVNQQYKHVKSPNNIIMHHARKL